MDPALGLLQEHSYECVMSIVFSHGNIYGVAIWQDGSDWVKGRCIV